jgi:two-component system, response regulator YesN
LEDKLTEALKKGDLSLVVEVNRQIFNSFSTIIDKTTFTVNYCYMQLLSSAIKCAFKMGINIEFLSNNSNLYEDLIKSTDLYESKLWFENLFYQICSRMEHKEENKNKSSIEFVAAYIEKNYDKDLNLTLLSEKVFLSTPYLSKIFKEEYGKTIKQYISEIRMEKAKELLKNPNLKIIDIAEKVGYDKVHGFLKQFKEYTGSTPGQFRDTLIYDEDLNL